MSGSEKVLEMWKETIQNFIKEREENKIIDLLSKKVPKKLASDEKQAINIRLEEALKKYSGVSRVNYFVRLATIRMAGFGLCMSKYHSCLLFRLFVVV